MVPLVCGAHLEATATPQKLVSHARYGDHHYDNGENCEWKIRAKEGHRILLRFTTFDLEDEAECGWVSQLLFLESNLRCLAQRQLLYIRVEY